MKEPLKPDALAGYAFTASSTDQKDKTPLYIINCTEGILPLNGFHFRMVTL